MTSPGSTGSEGYFDEFAGSYEQALGQGLAATGEGAAFYARERARWVARRLGAFGPCPGVILDYGCGTGAGVPFLLEAFPGASVVGVDVSVRSLAVARRTVASERAQFAAVREHGPDGQIDLAFCNGVFHHIPPSERDAAVEYVRRSLRPGGTFAFWENNPWNPGTRYVMSRIPFDRDAETLSPPAARALLRRGGFEVLVTDYRFFFPRLLRLLRPLEPALSRAVPLGGQYLILARNVGES